MELSAAAAVSGGGVMAAHTAAAIADVMDAWSLLCLVSFARLTIHAVVLVLHQLVHLSVGKLAMSNAKGVVGYGSSIAPHAHLVLTRINVGCGPVSSCSSELWQSSAGSTQCRSSS